MGFFSTVLSFIQDFLESLFASSSPEYKKKTQLKRIAQSLKTVDPPLYRPEGILLPTFPAVIYQLYQFLAPIRDILSATIGNPDRRAADRYRDFLIELSFSEEQRALRRSLTLAERSAALVAYPHGPERLIEEQGKQFAAFLKGLDAPGPRQVAGILARLDCLQDFCQFGFNSLFSYFDPAFKTYSDQDITVSSPSFHQLEVVEIVPVLLDLYYVLSRLELSPALFEAIAIMEARRANAALTEETRVRIGRIYQAILYIFQKRFNKEILLAIIRMTKQDPEFKPEEPRETFDYLSSYKTRLTEFFHSDSRRMLKDKEETEINGLISTTFGDLPLEGLHGYNEETNALLQEFTPFSLDWIKPIQVIRTFACHFFEPHFRQILRAVVVEGFFNNRTIQASFSSSYYYCESVSTKIIEFEHLFADNQPCSLKVLTGYITEMEKGIDFEKPLRKLVEHMNGLAKQFVQQTVNQYMDIYNFCVILLEDCRKSVPEYVTNIRALSGSTKNSESFSQLEREIGVFRNFLEIMKKYAIVGAIPATAGIAEPMEN